MGDYQQVLREVVVPEIEDTVFQKKFEEFEAVATIDNGTQGGKQIVRPLEVARDEVAENYDRNDVDPNGGGFTDVDAKWDKTYQQVAFEVHGIDESEATGGGVVGINGALIMDAAKKAMTDMSQLWWENFYTRLKADIDETATYSDAALSRSTYATLASFEENTDTAITIDIWRAAINAILLNKNNGDESNYLALVERQVYNKFKPLAAALNTWNINGVANQGVDAGYQAIANFEGVDVMSLQGMTTGDLFFVRPQDLFIRKHRGLTIKQVDSGKDSAKFVARAGVTSYVMNPGFQGKLTNKD